MQDRNGDADIENRLMDTGGWEEGESGMNGEDHGNIYTNICKIDTKGNLLYESGTSHQGDNLEG